MIKIIFLVIFLQNDIFCASVRVIEYNILCKRITNYFQKNFDLFFKSASIKVDPEYGNVEVELYNDRYFTIAGTSFKEMEDVFVCMRTKLCLMSGFTF